MRYEKANPKQSVTRLMWGVSLLAIFCSLLCTGCHYNLKYTLSERSIMQSQNRKPINVAVLVLDDSRDNIEKTKSAREESGESDAADYTYDRDFGGSVAERISAMLAKHLEFSNVFGTIRLLPERPLTAYSLMFDSLAGENIDAVLTGNIRHFYGYYDQNVGKQVLFGGGLALGIGIPVAIMTTTKEKKAFGFEEVKTNPIAISLATTGGFMLGSWLESTGSRRIEWHTTLDLELVSTSSGQTLWEGTAEVFDDEIKAMPGLKTATRKQEVAVNSLRLAINELVVILSSARIESE